MAILKTFKNVRKAYVKSPSASQAKHRLKSRYCVSVDLFPNERKKSAVKGVKLALKEQHGCFVSRREAERAAEKLSHKRSM